MTMCARCRIKLRWEDCQGESGLYSPNRAFTLCEPCFEEEDLEIDVRGMNDLPERLEEYRRNLRMGSLSFRSIAARSPIQRPEPTAEATKPSPDLKASQQPTVPE